MALLCSHKISLDKWATGVFNVATLNKEAVMGKTFWTVKIKGFGMTYSVDVFAASEGEARQLAKKHMSAGDVAVSAYCLPSFS
jgi:hypothetical protein